MIGATIFAVVFFVFLIAICIGFIILQIRLSKMDSKWPGLVLPAITLLLSLVAAITVFARADIGAYGNMWNVVLPHSSRSCPTTYPPSCWPASTCISVTRSIVAPSWPV